MRIAMAVLVGAVLAAITIGAGSGDGVDARARVRSRLATLRTHDPLTQTISLATGEAGRVFGERTVLNRQSDLDFGNYHEGCFSVGIEGGRTGFIIDLGSRRELAERYGYAEPVGGGHGYRSIRIEEDRLVIAGDRVMKESRILGLEGESCHSARVELGHIYLVRIVDRHDPGFERIAKLQVVSHVPGDSVTIRWDLLRDRRGRRGR